ncbi:hypothetical protein SynROS8604_01365 [Synechococcus sp. ROS8604]|nr:hypothetical protein SynROS8604_01365 [Synechococcus sp. ROS8604]
MPCNRIASDPAAAIEQTYQRKAFVPCQPDIRQKHHQTNNNQQK